MLQAQQELPGARLACGSVIVLLTLVQGLGVGCFPGPLSSTPFMLQHMPELA